MAKPKRTSLSDLMSSEADTDLHEMVQDTAAEAPAVAPAPVRSTASVVKPAMAPADRPIKKVSLYLHPAVKREIDTIAFSHETKAHDLYLEAIDLVLKSYGRSSIKQLEKK